MTNSPLTDEEIKNMTTEEIVEEVNDLTSQLAAQSEEMAKRIIEAESVKATKIDHVE